MSSEAFFSSKHLGAGFKGNDELFGNGRHSTVVAFKLLNH